MEKFKRWDIWSNAGTIVKSFFRKFKITMYIIKRKGKLCAVEKTKICELQNYIVKCLGNKQIVSSQLISIYFYVKFLSINNCCFPKLIKKSTFKFSLIKSLTSWIHFISHVYEIIVYFIWMFTLYTRCVIFKIFRFHLRTFFRIIRHRPSLLIDSYPRIGVNTF